MPYARERAGKGGHSDFVKNPDIQEFLRNCQHIREPSDDEAKAVASQFSQAPTFDGKKLPSYVVASDASKADTSVNKNLPSTQLGFIKVTHVIIAMANYAGLIRPGNRFVDPFKVAELHRNAHPVTYVTPGSNIKYAGKSTVKSGFRRAVFDQLNKDLGAAGRKVLTDTLLELHGGAIHLDSCTACKAPPVPPASEFVFNGANLFHVCPNCGEEIYLTDILRLHEGVSDFGDNTSATTRMMNAIEHLFIAGFIADMLATDPSVLSKIAFVMDGPLAIFGEPAKLHARVMALVHKANAKLASLGLDSLLMIGLQKTGSVMDHANLLKRHLPNGVIRVLDDQYRYQYIAESESENFGHETYYGQDFLFKTENGRIFNFAIPYPFAGKDVSGGKRAFSQKKVESARYGNLIGRACDLIRHFELDLYENAIVPVALAHRHASISLVPGGKVLDILAKAGLRGESSV
jgi:hypothetical protein